jgi:hypothetical protein
MMPAHVLSSLLHAAVNGCINVALTTRSLLLMHPPQPFMVSEKKERVSCVGSRL